MVEKRQNKWLATSKTALPLFSSDVKSKFPKKGIHHCIKIFARFFKGLAVLSPHKKQFLPSKQFSENLIDTRTLSLRIYFSLTLLENIRRAVFEETTYLSFSLP